MEEKKEEEKKTENRKMNRDQKLEEKMEERERVMKARVGFKSQLNPQREIMILDS